MRRAIVGIVTSALIVAGCRACGRDECSAAMPSRCDGNTFVWCEQTSAYGHQFPAKLIRAECGPKHTCVKGESGAVAGCARSPATTCDPKTFVGSCDGDTPLLCTTLSSYAPDNFVSEGGTCIPPHVCATAPLPYGPTCVKPDINCTLPPGKYVACAGPQLVTCADIAGGRRIEVVRIECNCTDDADGKPPHCKGS